MVSNKKYKKYLLTIILIVSLAGNLFSVIQLRNLRRRITRSNMETSIKLESAIRDTMYSIRELNKIDDEETMKKLQLSVHDLALISNNWLSLNKFKDRPEGQSDKGSNSLETLRNAVVYHLGNQYKNNGKLTHYDIVFLDKAYERLERLLDIYGNIQKPRKIIKWNKGDSGLDQWIDSVEEMCRLYRHSRVPNEHLNYADLDVLLAKTYKKLPVLKDFKGTRDINEPVQVREGIHYYEINYYYGQEPAYLLWIDAVDGSLKLYEAYIEEAGGKNTFRNEAFNIAKNFINKFLVHNDYDDFIEKVSIINNGEGPDNTIYSFEFTPVKEDISIVSDSISVDVAARTGNVIKYSNSFNGTEVPATRPTIAIEDLEEIWADKLANAEYNGLSVVRSFYTNYNPAVAYNYKSVEDENIGKLYFDVVTGNQIYESYSVYEPIYYITEEDRY